jgi:hypothetical protein
VEIRNPNLLDEAEEPEIDSIYRPMRILNFTDGLRETKPGIRLSVDRGCNEKRAAAVGQRIIRIIAFLLLENLKVKETSVLSVFSRYLQ